MNKVYLGLGSNLGNKLKNLKSTINFFVWDDRFDDIKTSPFYLTSPYGNEAQDNFINCAISFYTSLSIDALFNLTKELERRVGRTEKGNLGPRVIDIDILFYGDQIINNHEVTVPHKDLHNRDFVIIPLLDLDPNIFHPALKKKLKSFLSQLKDKYIIDKIYFNIFEENSEDQTNSL